MKIFSFLFVTFAFSFSAYSQSSNYPTERSSTSVSQVSPVSSQGVRVSILGAALNFEMTASAFGHTTSYVTPMDNASGFSLGYAYLPLRTLGFTTNLSYLALTKDSESINFGRLDGNMTYAFNRTFNLQGGANISRITSGGDGSFSKLSPGLGGQIGLGAQLTKNFGLDLMYVQMNQAGNIEIIGGTVKMATQESGAELNLSGTF